jgi:uncharacterized protein YkwD
VASERPCATDMFIGKPGAARRPSRRVARAGCAFALGAAFMLMLTAAGGAATSPLSPCLDDDGARRAVESINQLRAHGAPCAPTDAVRPLVWQTSLAITSGDLAADLAWRDELSHLDARQRALGVRLAAGGYAARTAGENLAAGQRDFAQTLEAWARSPKHCANLMSPLFDDVGLACVERKGSRYERFWVAQLGRR